jgi:hypothetical protein
VNHSHYPWGRKYLPDTTRSGIGAAQSVPIARKPLIFLASG